jgi:ABC-type phosphate/phosphonate transport system substrate-binding protein
VSNICVRTVVLLAGLLLSFSCTRPLHAVEPYGPADAQITIVAMDPMAAPLACDCVKGYAQRKYESLADYLRESTGLTVRVVWSESITSAQKSQAKSIQVVIGKDSVVRADAKQAKLDLIPIAHLSDMSGSIKQKGLFVVLRDNPAATLLDLDGYQILFGPQDCDEKDAAPKKKLSEIDVDYSNGEVCSSCSTAAKKLTELSPTKKVAAVISSYAAPLLEGCGTIKKGDLKIVGESDTVPFISAFVDSSVSNEVRESIEKALLEMHKSPSMLKEMETQKGFVPYSLTDEPVEKKSPVSSR